jgi:tRNA-specific adenosine deaminase 1
VGKHAALPSRPFRLKNSVSIHFFTTEAPCGDASMELLMNSMPPGSAEPWKNEDPEGLKQSLQGRGHFSMLGFVRRKPARGDAEPSNSKSCTDKLAIKQFMSVIAFPNDLLVEKTDNTYIRTMVVYADQFNETGYPRAFGPDGRLSRVSHLGRFFDVSTLPHDFPRFAFDRAVLTAASPGQQKPKVTNMTALWIHNPEAEAGGVLEILVNGVKQGYRQWEDREGKASIISRRKLWDLAVTILGPSTQIPDEHDRLEPSSTTMDSAGSSQLQDISRVLTQSTYAQAKLTFLRNTSRDIKCHITAALGNWKSNEEDKDWQRTST